MRTRADVNVKTLVNMVNKMNASLVAEREDGGRTGCDGTLMRCGETGSG